MSEKKPDFLREVSDSRLRTLVNALRGIASCATRCGCCEMHNRIANKALTDTGLYHGLCEPDPLDFGYGEKG
jgi:hypothetical protein